MKHLELDWRGCDEPLNFMYLHSTGTGCKRLRMLSVHFGPSASSSTSSFAELQLPKKAKSDPFPFFL